MPDASKVPQVTLWFWIIKIAAATLGETGGDAVTMSPSPPCRSRPGAFTRCSSGA